MLCNKRILKTNFQVITDSLGDIANGILFCLAELWKLEKGKSEIDLLTLEMEMLNGF